MISQRIIWTIGLLMCVSACAPHRIEYRPQSAIETSLGAGVREDVHLDNGTIIRFTEAPQKKSDGPAFKGQVEETHLRVENEDGTVELRSTKPVDLIHNLMNCLRTREYQLIWEQLVSMPTLQRYEDNGHDIDHFVAVMEKRRIDLGRTLTRMQRGLRNNEATIKRAPNGLLRIQLQPSVASDFRYTKVDMIEEEQGNFRLVRIH